jgi:hypothetical protein
LLLPIQAQTVCSGKLAASSVWRAQFITYTIARLSHHVGKRLPVTDIWRM